MKEITRSSNMAIFKVLFDLSLLGLMFFVAGCAFHRDIPAANFDFTASKSPHGRTVPEAIGSPAITIHFPLSVSPEAIHHWRDHFVTVHDHDSSQLLTYFNTSAMFEVWEKVWAEMVSKSTYWVLEMYDVLSKEFPEHQVVLVPWTVKLNEQGEMEVGPVFEPPPSAIEVHFSTYLDFQRFYDPSNSLMYETYGQWLTPLMYFVVSSIPEGDHRRVAAGSWKRLSRNGVAYYRFDQPSIMHAKHRYAPYSRTGWFKPGFGVAQSPRPYHDPGTYFYLPGVVKFSDAELSAYQNTPFDSRRAPSYGYWLSNAGILEEMLQVHPPEPPAVVNHKYLKVLGLKAEILSPELNDLLEEMRFIESTFLSEQDRDFVEGALYSEWGESLRVMLLAEKMQKDSHTAASNAAFFSYLGSVAGMGLQTQGNFLQNPAALMQMGQTVAGIVADNASDHQTLEDVFQNHFQRTFATQREFIAKSGDTELEIRASNLSEMREQFSDFLMQFPGISAAR